MSDNKIIDGVSDVKTEIHHEGDDIIVNRVQAIGGILDANTIDYNNYTAPTKDNAMKRVASIPMVIVEKGKKAVSYTQHRAHATVLDIVCRLLLVKKKDD